MSWVIVDGQFQMMGAERRMVEPPPCPVHGTREMQSMAEVGAPRWFTCAASALAPGGICGYSAHAEDA